MSDHDMESDDSIAPLGASTDPNKKASQSTGMLADVSASASASVSVSAPTPASALTLAAASASASAGSPSVTPVPASAAASASASIPKATKGKKDRPNGPLTDEMKRKRLEELGEFIWPDQEAKDSFTKLSGYAPYERDPFNNFTFRKIYEECKEQPRMTERDRALLFGSAIEATARKTVKIRVETDKKTSHKRRKRIATSSGSHPKKLAQEKGVASTTSPETSGAAPPLGEPTLGEDDEDVPLDEHFVYDVTDRKVVRTKEYHKYLLQVYEMGEDEGDKIPIPAAKLRDYFDKLQEAVYGRMLEGLVLPQVLWYARSRDGAGLIACADETSQDVIKMIVRETTMEERLLKAWDRSEIGFVTITLLLKHALAKKSFLDKPLFEAVKKQNKVLDDEDQVKFVDSTWKGDKDEVRIFRMQVTFEVLKKLKALGGKVFLLMSNIEIRKGGVPICPQNG